MSFVSTILQAALSRGKTSHEVRALGSPGQEGGGRTERESGGSRRCMAFPPLASPLHPPARPSDARIQGQGVLCVGLRGQTDAGGSAGLGPAAERARVYSVHCTGRCKMLRDRYECLFRVIKCKVVDIC